MPQIITAIPPQQFEIIRDRIGDILVDEISNQYAITSDPDLLLSIGIERSISLDKTELSIINISLAKGNWENKNVSVVNGLYTYNIDIYTSSPSTDADGGDPISSIKLQKLLGIVRAILENAAYRTLGFTPGHIARVGCLDLNIAAQSPQDALNTAMGRIQFSVLAMETMELKIPVLITGYKTTVKMGSTGIGYLWQGN